MGSQFIHIESYGRTAGKGKSTGKTIRAIVGEAEREEGQCFHVENPTPPVILYGVSFKEAEKEAEKWAENQKDPRGHKLRKDALCMVAGVVSAPEDLKNWDKYKKDVVHWLNKKYGKALRSVIEHTDESHKHIHFAVVPEGKNRFETIHDGYLAQRIANPKRGDRKRSKEDKVISRRLGIKAYKEAMRAYQDDFYKSVSKKYGLTRIGPACRRLSRAEWKAEQAQAMRIAETLQELGQERSQTKELFEKANAKAKVIEEAGKKENVVLFEFLQKQFTGLSYEQKEECWQSFIAKTNEVRSVNNQEKNQKKGISR